MARSLLLFLLCLLPQAGCTVCRPQSSCATVANSSDARQQYTVQAKIHLKRGRTAAGDGRPARSVDLFYRAATFAWQAMFETGPPPADLIESEMLSVYNEAVGRCLAEGLRSGRFDPARGLRVRTSEGWREFPVVPVGLRWEPARLDQLKFVSGRGICCWDDRYPGRRGLGAPMLAIHEHDPSDPRDRHQFAPHPYPFTAVLQPASGNSGGQIEFHEVLRHTGVAAAGQVWPLSAEPSAATEAAERYSHPEQDPYLTFFVPEIGRNCQGLYMLEPYQPGRIPLVFVHGFLSYPWTWTEMVDALRADPQVMERYQIWLYSFPTALPVAQAAADLRDDLRATVAGIDPEGTDPALDHVVIAGHSMGGILAKMQAVSSGDVLWNAFANRPFSQVKGDAETLAFFERMYFFEPLPFVTRVLYFAVPHSGSSFSDQFLRCVGRTIAGRLNETEEHFRRLRRDNPGVITDLPPALSPTSLVNLATPSPLLEGLNELSPPPYIHQHTIYGDADQCCLRERGDGVIPVDSARISGVTSELRVPVGHRQVHRDSRSVAEMKRILDEHWFESFPSALPPNGAESNGMKELPDHRGFDSLP